MQIVLGLECGDVLVNGRDRRQLKPARNLFVTGTVPVLNLIGGNEIEYFLLPAS